MSPIFRAEIWATSLLSFLTMSVFTLELRDLAWYKKQRHQKAISRVHFFITTTKQSLIWKFYCDSLKPCICPSNKSKNKTTSIHLQWRNPKSFLPKLLMYLCTKTDTLYLVITLYIKCVRFNETDFSKWLSYVLPILNPSKR